MAIVYQKYYGQITITSANNTFYTDDTAGYGQRTVDVTTGSYYLDGYTGESTAQLCNTIQSCIRGLAAHGNDNVYISNDKVVIHTNIPTILTWHDAPLAYILGFNGTTANVSVHTGTLNPRYTWHPSVGAVYFPTNLHHLWEPESKTRYVRSTDGSCHSVAGTTVYSAKISYKMVPLNDSIKAASQIYQSFQEFYEDIMAAGKPFRIYPDKSYSNSSSYYTAMLGEEEPKTFSEYVTRSIDAYQGYWDIEFPMWKVV